MTRPPVVREGDEERECHVHGMTPHRLLGNGLSKTGKWHEAWRCLQCKRERDQKRKALKRQSK